jgi:hypothetical protein
MSKRIMLAGEGTATRRGKDHLRRKSFFNGLEGPRDDADCCLAGGAPYAAADESEAYMVCASRGDWWKDANAFGAIGLVGNMPQVGEVGGDGYE